MFFCVFKKKTAYDMRISDWSSDVCSSDLEDAEHGGRARRRRRHAANLVDAIGGADRRPFLRLIGRKVGERHLRGVARRLRHRLDDRLRVGAGVKGVRPARRSEEHTSELQSLMRISYAVVCLKKTNRRNDGVKT